MSDQINLAAGNVMHMMEGVDAGAEDSLFDEHDNLSEASVSNAFVVSGNTIATPALDQHKLAGVTRDMAPDFATTATQSRSSPGESQ